MRQLDQVEKRLLRIIAIQRQMSASGAVNDFEKTINSASNQTKQLAETLKEVGLWLGQLTMSFMQPFIEKVLAGAIALREMLKALNIAKGYEMPDFGKGDGFENIKEQTDDATESTEELIEKEEQLKRVLLGFDKLNILGENKQEETTPNYDILTNELKKYEGMLSKVQSRASKTAENILTWLGYTKQVNSETGEVNWELAEGETNLNKIIAAVNVLGVALAGLGLKKVFGLITSNLTSIITHISSITKLFNPMTVALTTIVAGFTTLYQTNEEFRKSVDAAFGSIKDNLNKIYTIFEPFIKMANESLAEQLDILLNIGANIGKLVVDTLNLVTAFLSFSDVTTALENVGADITQIFVNLWDSFVAYSERSFDAVFGQGSFDKVMNWFSNTWENLKNFFKAIPSWFNDHIIKPIGNFFIIIINGIINGVETAINFIVKGINSMTGVLSNLWTWMGIPAIPQIPQVNWSGIPMLANGGVIEQPTMAMVGEYAGAKSNPEIVTPQNIMRQTFMECMLPIAQAIISGDTKVVNAIEELANRPIELNGRKVSESIFSNLQDVAIRKGYTF